MNVTVIVKCENVLDCFLTSKGTVLTACGTSAPFEVNGVALCSCCLQDLCALRALSGRSVRYVRPTLTGELTPRRLLPW